MLVARSGQTAGSNCNPHLDVGVKWAMCLVVGMGVNQQ